MLLISANTLSKFCCRLLIQNSQNCSFFVAVLSSERLGRLNPAFVERKAKKICHHRQLFSHCLFHMHCEQRLCGQLSVASDCSSRTKVLRASALQAHVWRTNVLLAGVRISSTKAYNIRSSKGQL